MALNYNSDESINKPLYSIVVLLIYLIMLIYIIVLINSIYNVVIFFSNEASYNVLISDTNNLSKNITESYQYRTLNYVKSFEEIEEDIDKKKADDENAPCTISTLTGMPTMFFSNDKFSLEKDFSLLFEYNLYNIIFKLLCIILFIIFFGIIINTVIEFFLKKKNYIVTGNNSMFSYITGEKNDLILTITAIFTLAVFIYLSIYKFYFIDNVYNNIYNIYKSILQLDIFILDESNKINIIDNYFFVMLKNIVIKKSNNKYIISEDYEKYIIENNIEKTENKKIKVSKYLILGFYKYIINVNKDIDIINKLNNFIIHKNGDLETNKAISLRDYLPISLDEDNIDTKINKYFDFSITDAGEIALLDSKKENLKRILTSLDNKLILNEVVYNIIIYVFILIGLNCFIVFLILIFVYKNDYDNNEKTKDADENFRIIKKFIINVLEKIRRIFFRTREEVKVDDEKFCVEEEGIKNSWKQYSRP